MIAAVTSRSAALCRRITCQFSSIAACTIACIRLSARQRSQMAVLQMRMTRRSLSSAERVGSAATARASSITSPVTFCSTASVIAALEAKKR